MDGALIRGVPQQPRERRHSMRPMTSSDARLSRVTVEFKESSIAFLMPRKATYQDLAERMAAMATGHRGVPLIVEVRRGSQAVISARVIR